MSNVEDAVHAHIEKQCPICGRYKYMRYLDLRDDGLGFKWACDAFVGDGIGGYDTAGCGWTEV